MRTSLNFHASACLMAALLVLTLPLKWLMAAFLAAAFHEFCHIAVIKLLGGDILSLTVNAGGAVIETAPMTRGRELASAIAGPLGSLFIVCFCHRIPRIAICAGVQAVFNLLPLFPMDGGRILRCGTELLLPEKWANFICAVLERLTVTGVLILALLGLIWFDWGIFPFVFAAVMLTKAVLRKIPCKEAKLRVQ